MRALILLAAPLLFGCQTDEVTAVSLAPKLVRIEAVVEIDPASSAKSFQGVWLVRDDGVRLLIAYRSDPLWAGFAGKQVIAVIERYTPGPDAQAIQAPHARVHKLEADAELQTPLVDVGPVETFKGRLETRTGEPGTKRAAEPWMVLVLDGGAELMLANGFDLVEGPIEVRGRRVVRSPYVAHMLGPHVWLLDAP